MLLTNVRDERACLSVCFHFFVHLYGAYVSMVFKKKSNYIYLMKQFIQLKQVIFIFINV